MKPPFSMLSPCDECPFLKQGGARLTEARILEVAGPMLMPQGGAFDCHKTTGTTGGTGPAHCAGALLFALKHDNWTQMMRIAERLGRLDAERLSGGDLIFDSLEEMLATAVDRPKRRRHTPQTRRKRHCD